MASLAVFLCAGISLGAALSADGRKDLYTLDTSWKPRFPSGAHTFSAVGVAHTLFPGSSSTPIVFVTQRGNASLDPVLVMNATDGALLDSWGKDTVGLDYSKTPPTWGAHGLATEECRYPCADAQAVDTDFMRVYVDDFTNHTLTMYTSEGKMLMQLGQNGVAGNGSSPLQFDHIADSDIETGYVAPGGITGPTYVYSSDGDGGHANRVVKVAIKGTSGHVEWASKQIFNNPHSIALHQSEWQSQPILIVANRENNETRLLHASTGEDLGAWDCGLDYGKSGKPFGVRFLSYHDAKCNENRDLLLVAIMDNPQDGLNQRIAIVDASRLNPKDGHKSKCTVLQIINIDPKKYSGPHLLGVDHKNGDIYAALVADAPLSTVLRYKSTGCVNSEDTLQV